MRLKLVGVAAVVAVAIVVSIASNGSRGPLGIWQVMESDVVIYTRKGTHKKRQTNTKEKQGKGKVRRDRNYASNVLAGRNNCRGVQEGKVRERIGERRVVVSRSRSRNCRW